MRLLAKEELAKAKSSDREKEVSEGLKLSRRVDGLRELAAKEGETLEKFRSESLSVIHGEISRLNSEKEDLEVRVKELRDEREKGFNDLKERESELNLRENGLDESEKSLDDREEEIGKKEEEIISNLKNSQDELLRIKGLSEESNRAKYDAELDREEARQTLENARKIERTSIQDDGEIRATLAPREKMVELREKVCEIREKENEETKRQNEKDRILLKDERETLERAMKRLQK